MKRNINKLITQIERGSSANPRGRFKMTSKNANQYTNKILVDANQYNKPTHAQKIVEGEMQEYRQFQKQTLKNLQEEINEKKTKYISLQQQVNKLEGSLSILIMEDVMAALRIAKRDELLNIRPQLLKLEQHLLFKLKKEELQPHMQQPLVSFLKELTEVINKASKLS